MTYRLDTSLPLGDAVKAVAVEQTTRALEAITNREETVAWRIHELRKCCKKTRALFRLVRSGFPAYRDANRLYRDTARIVAPHRDARVMAILAEHLSADIFHDPVAHWFDFQAEIAEQVSPEPLSDVGLMLRNALVQLGHWQFDEIRREDVLEGFAKTLKVVHTRSDSISAKSKSEKAHEWRKCVKDHWYHLRLLRDVLPIRDRGRIAAFGDLGELIGDAHDRAVFVDRLKRLPVYLADTRWSDALGDTAKRERKALQADAIKLATPLLEGSGKGFVKRVGRKWKKLDGNQTETVKLVHVR